MTFVTSVCYLDSFVRHIFSPLFCIGCLENMCTHFLNLVTDATISTCVCDPRFVQQTKLKLFVTDDVHFKVVFCAYGDIMLNNASNMNISFHKHGSRLVYYYLSFCDLAGDFLSFICSFGQCC